MTTEAEVEAPLSLGELIDRRADAYALVKEREQQVKLAKGLVDELDDQILKTLDEQGLPGARGHKATMSVQESTVPNVKNWAELYDYIKENGYFHLLNRAPNAAAFRELFTRGTNVPGVEPFTKRSLHFRSN